MPQGGKRHGAGAPKGNLNALRHGRHSTHFQSLLHDLAQIPHAHETFLAFQRINQRKIQRAKKAARYLFCKLLQQIPPKPDQELNQTIQQLILQLGNLQHQKPENTISPKGEQSKGLATNPHLMVELPSFPKEGDLRRANPAAILGVQGLHPPAGGLGVSPRNTPQAGGWEDV